MTEGVQKLDLTPSFNNPQEVLDANPVFVVAQMRKEAANDYALLHPCEHANAETTRTLIQQRMGDDPSLRKVFEDHDSDTPEGVAAIAEAFGLPLDQLQRTFAYSTARNEVMDAVVSDEELIGAWHTLKARAGIQDIAGDEFEKIIHAPRLVLFSADWCPPCRLIRPTFAHLVPFFDTAEVRYCGDEEVRHTQLVRSVPQLVAYFPGGARVRGRLPLSAGPLWRTMCSLIALGQSYQGEGWLHCDDGVCEIRPDQPK